VSVPSSEVSRTGGLSPSMDSRFEEPKEMPFLVDLSSGEEEVASAYLMVEEECALK
jgi:hypothetical protein